MFFKNHFQTFWHQNIVKYKQLEDSAELLKQHYETFDEWLQ